MVYYKCINYEECNNMISCNERGRKPIRCKKCQELYSKKLRRDAYRQKVKNKVKITKCIYEFDDNSFCDSQIPYVTNKPKYCPKHARKIRLAWLRKYYTGKKIVYCSNCNRPIQYETKKPDLCLVCRSKQRIRDKIEKISKKGK